MRDELRMASPERVEFSYQLAGIGSRFLAVLIDHLIQSALLSGAALLLIAVIFGMWAGTEAWDLRHLDKIITSFTWIVWAVLLVVVFAITWGYFVFFEMTRNGQTPGKKIANLRVIREGGYSVDFFASVVRNLVRYFDFLPAGYFVGVGIMFFSPQSKRAGDYAAGTVVIKERGEKAPEVLRLPQSEIEPSTAPPPPGIERITRDEYTMVREFLLRRAELEPGSRNNLARRLAGTLAGKLELEAPIDPAACEQFLERVAREYREHAR